MQPCIDPLLSLILIVVSPSSDELASLSAITQRRKAPANLVPERWTQSSIFLVLQIRLFSVAEERVRLGYLRLAVMRGSCQSTARWLL